MTSDQMTGNQRVARNLRIAREYRGWTQKQAAAAISQQLDSDWSTESYAQAERSATRARTRRFDADELDALSRAFELPLTFFLPSPVLERADGSETVALVQRWLADNADELRRVADNLERFAALFESEES